MVSLAVNRSMRLALFVRPSQEAQESKDAWSYRERLRKERSVAFGGSARRVSLPAWSWWMPVAISSATVLLFTPQKGGRWLYALSLFNKMSLRRDVTKEHMF